MKRIAAFITPHGLGHATRTIAILQALQQRIPSLHIDLFTTVSANFFYQQLKNVTLHSVSADIGLIQPNALEIDLPATIKALDALLPYTDKDVAGIAKKIEHCSCVICDIAPLGIVAAQKAGIPSVLIENFTWDWIYKPYVDQYPALSSYIELFAAMYAKADHHIQVIPHCQPVKSSVLCPPVFRQTLSSPESIRLQLNCSGKKLVVISMGGIDFSLPVFPELKNFTTCFFVFTGQEHCRRIHDNCLTLDHTTTFYHPDLMSAADLVICKSGYSTVAECYQNGTPICLISRPSFRESEIIEKFIQTTMQGIIITEKDFISGNWISSLKPLLALPRALPAPDNGADCVADTLLSL